MLFNLYGLIFTFLFIPHCLLRNELLFFKILNHLFFTHFSHYHIFKSSFHFPSRCIIWTRSNAGVCRVWKKVKVAVSSEWNISIFHTEQLHWKLPTVFKNSMWKSTDYFCLVYDLLEAIIQIGWKCTQAIKDVEEFVSLSDLVKCSMTSVSQQWYGCNWYSAVNGCRQNESPNSW